MLNAPAAEVRAVCAGGRERPARVGCQQVTLAPVTGSCVSAEVTTPLIVPGSRCSGEQVALAVTMGTVQLLVRPGLAVGPGVAPAPSVADDVAASLARAPRSRCTRPPAADVTTSVT